MNLGHFQRSFIFLKKTEIDFKILALKSLEAIRGAMTAKSNLKEVKEDEWIMPRVPGLWLWIRCIHEVFFLGETPTNINHVPHKVLEATEEFLSAECAAALRDWLDQNMVATTESRDAITKTALLRRLKFVTPFEDLKPKEIEDTLTRTCKVVTVRGVREMIKYALKGGELVYIKG